MRNWIENTLAVVAVSLFAGLAIAQRTTEKDHLPVRSDAKFSIHLDLNAMKDTQIGRALLSIVKQQALQELGRMLKGVGKEAGSETVLQRVKESLGLDPFEDIQAITISASEFDDPEDSLVAVVRLKKTSGNLEGLALGLPGYQSFKHGEHEFHSAMPNDRKRVYGAVHGEGDQDRMLVLSPSLEIMHHALDELDDRGDEVTDAKDANAVLASLNVFEMPEELVNRGPQAAVAKIIKSLSLSVEQSDENLRIAVNLSTENPKQAEQLKQMASGLVAMIDLAQSMDNEDRDLQQFREAILAVNSEAEENEVRIRIDLDADSIMSAARKEFHLEQLEHHEAAEKLAEKHAEESQHEAEAKGERARLKAIEEKLKATEEELAAKRAELEAMQESLEAKLEETKAAIEKIKATGEKLKKD